MRILQVAAFAAPFKGNFIYSLEKLELMANREGHKVYYVFPENAMQEQWCLELKKRTKVFFLPLSKARIKVKTYTTLRKICKENHIDVIHSHFELYDLPCLYAARKTSIKVVWHLHDAIDIETTFFEKTWYKMQYRFLSKKVKMIVISEYYKKMLQKYGVITENINIIYNGVNVKQIKKVENENFKEKVFVTIGGDFYRKGFDLILQACEKLFSSGKNFKLVISGNEFVKNKIQEWFSGILPEWLEFYLPVSDINDILKKGNVFIQASRFETFSFAVCEAAYSGLEILISDINGMKWAQELPTAEIFTSENVDELVNLMNKKVESSFVIEAIEKTRDIIQKKYSSERWASEVLGVYYE